jgi:hypothetical protein
LIDHVELNSVVLAREERATEVQEQRGGEAHATRVWGDVAR